MPASLPVEPLNPPKEVSIVDDLYICPRTSTVQKLATLLDEKRVVHVRGTPTSGKTTLAHLLWEYYSKRRMPVVLLTGWHNVIDRKAHLISQCEACGYSGIERTTLLKADVVFILDEAQQSYNDIGLWLGIIKTQSGKSGGPKFCLFTSYGSPSTGSTKYPPASTPVHFGASQRISITSSSFAENGGVCLFYSKEEFEDVVSRLCSNPIGKFALDPAACKYLFSITNGHPGATDALVKLIFKVCMSYRMYWNVITNTVDLPNQHQGPRY